MSLSPSERRRLAETEVSVVDALYRISSLTAQIEDPREALEIVIDEIIRVLPASSAAIELINPDTQLLEIEVFRGFPEHSKEVQLRLGQGVTGWVALHGRPLLVPDVREDSRYIPVSASIRCELAVPMLNEEGTTIGVVNIDSETVNAFDERDRKVLALLTSEASKVVGRLWMIRKLREQADQLRALVNTGRSIVRQRETGELLRSLTEEAITLMQCRVSALYLYDAKRRTLTLEAVSGMDAEQIPEETLELGESALGTAVRRHKTIEVHDLARSEEHHFVGIAQKYGLVAVLSAPIMYENEVIGLINAYHDRPHRFSNSERRAFETLAGIGASAIQNARLYSRIFQSEESLRRTERLTTLGLLSAEIAHEIRNPLTVIRLLFDALDLDFPSTDPRAKDVEIIGEKLDHLEAIVSRVLSFGKSREDMKIRLDLRKVVADTIHLVRLKLQQGKIALEVEQPQVAVMVEANRGQLQQSLLNLIINATQAMPEGGSIRVAIEQTPEHVACIDITDTGPGVPEGIQHEIFESFLTGRSEGTGLGLAIVKRILRSHHGDVELVQSSSSGTTMRIWLPAV